MTTKTKLVWRLGKLPSIEELRELVKDKILTNDEAREILFSSEKEEERDEKSLKTEIKFLREIIEKLSTDRPRIVEVIREIKVPYYQQPWYQPYRVWCQAGTGASPAINTITTGGLLSSNITSSGTSGNFGVTTALNSAMQALQKFSQINTFN